MLNRFLILRKCQTSECKENDIIEIDTFNELKKVDLIYDV